MESKGDGMLFLWFRIAFLTLRHQKGPPPPEMMCFYEETRFGIGIRVHLGTETGPRQDPGNPVRKL